ncbi:MAG: hypothetical protein LRY76_09475 [Alphaproteobacteria bacterium]|nr:hypothetical protein [Alphaproteobacteria bacterium]MCD8571724.1 hypothetical protein [Alphaproteobacteria bacterium]
MKVSDYAVVPDLSNLFAECDRAKQDLKATPQDDSLTSTFLRAADEIREQAAFVRITPDTDRRLLEQLWRDEKVHPTDTFEEYLATRIGWPGDHKAAFALVAQDENGPRAIAAIYVYYDNIKPDGFGVVNLKTLRGDIHTIKTEVPRALEPDEDPDVAYFYTVTSKLPKAAYTLIRKVGEMHDRMLKSTISPAREFTRGRDMDVFDALPEDERRAQLADYISTREGYDDMDSVAFFHMDNGNGAYAGWASFNPGKPDDRVMMHYIYSNNPGLAFDNQRAFRAGYVPMGRALWSTLSSEKQARVYAVDEALSVAPYPPEQEYTL